MEITSTSPERQALLENYTEDFREARARGHERIAADCAVQIDTLNEWAASYGGGGELGRAISRTCPTCGAAPNVPCASWQAVESALAPACPRCDATTGEKCIKRNGPQTGPCAKCGAAPGFPCVRTKGTRAGEPTKHPHESRVRLHVRRNTPHKERASLVRVELLPLAELHDARAGMRELDRRRIFHDRRAGGQRKRFDTLRGCGKQMIAAKCSCGDKGKANPKGCGQGRLCGSCSERESQRRRRRFGEARGLALLDAVRNVPGRGAIAGTRAKFRRGGRYTDKMITLTIPHIDGPALYSQALDIDGQGDTRDDARAAATRRILAMGSDTVTLRISLVLEAWPLFQRRMRAHLKARGAGDHLLAKFDRFFEWTPASDGQGHPHIHAWMFAPYLCREAVAAMWTDALRAVGVPMRTHEEQCERCGCAHVLGARVWVQQMGDFDERAVRELIAGRKAIELASFRTFDIGPNAQTYAGSWSLQDIAEQVDAETYAKVYCALEGRRLSQASRGFYSQVAPPSCPCCGAMGSRSVEVWSGADEERTRHWNETRGPPIARTTPATTTYAQERATS